MKLLCISFMWTGMIDFFTKGSRKITGMPAFHNVIKAICESEKIDYTTIILVWDSDKCLPIKLDQEIRNKIEVYVFKWNVNRNRFINLVNLLIYSGRIILKTRPNLYLGFGSISFVTYFFKLLHHAPDQRRLYGISTVYEDYHRSALRVFIKHPFSYLSLRLPATRLFISNDGSRGDMVYSKFGSKKTDFHFLYNGVTKYSKGLKERNPIYLTYIGRIYPWKGQVHFIKALGILKRSYNLEFPVRIIGQLEDKEYVMHLKSLIDEYGLEKVIFTGAITVQEVSSYLMESIMTFAFYKTSNFGNVTIEALSQGIPLVSYNVNDSLSHLPVDSYFNVASIEADDIACAIKNLHDNPKLLLSLSKNSRAFAEQSFKSWERRAEIELNIVDQNYDRNS